MKTRLIFAKPKLQDLELCLSMTSSQKISQNSIQSSTLTALMA